MGDGRGTATLEQRWPQSPQELETSAQAAENGDLLMSPAAPLLKPSGHNAAIPADITIEPVQPHNCTAPLCPFALGLSSLLHPESSSSPLSSLSVPSPPPRFLLPGQPSLELMLCSFPPHVRHNQEPGLTSLGPLSIFSPLPFLPCECLENPSPLLVVPAILPPPPAGVNAGPPCPPRSEHLDHWLCTASPPPVSMSLFFLQIPVLSF